jgi:pSer/pThr/pTyr-binding forkhead associated (FHA) protein
MAMNDGETRRRKREVPAPPAPRFLETHRVCLVLIEGPGAGREWPLDSARQIIGRGEDVDLHFADTTMSKEHAAFEALEDGFRVRDLGSTNGVQLNDAPVLAADLDHGDRIRVGEHVFQYIAEPLRGGPRVHVIDEI